MNTTDAAAVIGTQPRTLRQFLRSSMSTFQPVGSGARYEFVPDDMPLLKEQFDKWANGGRPKSEGTTPRKPIRKSPEERQAARDQEVWDEEGKVVLPDIRDPRVRLEVRRRAAEAERLLMTRLVAVGMHVSQGGNR